MIEIKFYSEVCCDTCHDVIHNHMHCPAMFKTMVKQFVLPK
jgi:hypothetical protein